MKYILVLIFIVKINLPFIKSECYLDTSTDKKPIYFQKFGSEEYLITVAETGLTTFPEGTKLRVYCSSGFPYNFDFSDINFEPDNEIEIVCTNSDFKLINAFGARKSVSQFSTQNYRNYHSALLACIEPTTLEVYETSANKTDSLKCHGKHYYLGLNIKHNPIYFGDICYDLQKQKLEYVHFITPSYDLPILSLYLKTSPSGFTNYNLNNKVIVPTDMFIHESFIKNEIEFLKWNNMQIDHLTYTYVDFLPSSVSEPFVEYNTTSKTNKLSNFLGWDNFQKGNWKKFNELLQSRSEYDTYDVYMGTSHVVEAVTENGLTKNLTIKQGSHKIEIPQYIWTYLKSQNTTEHFVVIGVNSPYFEHNEELLCQDMCHKIKWLEQFHKTRKYPFFGYMFCCETKEALQVLDGFSLVQDLYSIANSTQN